MFNLSSLNVALPRIAEELNANALQLGWIPSIFLLTMTAFALPSAKFAGNYGRKKLYTIGLILFLLSSIVTYWVSHINLLFLVRGIQGIGASFLFSTGLAIIISMYGKRGGFALGLVLTAVYLGLSLGPFLGGLILEYTDWQTLMFFPVPFIFISILLTELTIKNEWVNQVKESIDWASVFIISLVLVTIFVGVSSTELSFTLVLLVFSVISLYVFINRQYTIKNPLVNLDILTSNKPFYRSLSAMFFVYGANYSVVILLSLYLQYIYALSPFEAGKLLLIQAFVMAVLSPIAGHFGDRFNGAIIATIGCGFMCFSYLFLGLSGAQTPLWQIGVGLFFTGFGFGLFSAPNNSYALQSVSAEQLNLGSALLGFTRNLGSVISTIVIMLLINLSLGTEKINPQNYPDLINIFRIAMLISCGFSIIAGWFSYHRTS